MVRLDKFNDSSIDIIIYGFTNTNNWKEFLKIKESLAIKIKEIVEAIIEKIGTQPNQFSQQLYLSYNKNINNPKQLVTNKVDAPEGYLKEIADFYQNNFCLLINLNF